MKIKLVNEPALSTLYLYSKNWPAFSNDFRFLATFRGGLTRESIACNYCLCNGIQSGSIEESKSELLSFELTSCRKFLNKFKVEFVASTFAEEVQHSREALYHSFSSHTLYDILGDDNGILVLDNHVVAYCISSQGCFFFILNRFGSFQPECYYVFDIKNGLHPKLKFDNLNTAEFPPQHIQDVVSILMFKKYAQIRTQMIGRHTRITSLDSNGIIFNDTPFNISQLDITWYTNYVNNDDINVRGFWRLQAYGKNHSDRRLVYIKPFVRHGYHRKAKRYRTSAA